MHPSSDLAKRVVDSTNAVVASTSPTQESRPEAVSDAFLRRYLTRVNKNKDTDCTLYVFHTTAVSSVCFDS
jgi:hypothetical protein